MCSRFLSSRSYGWTMANQSRPDTHFCTTGTGFHETAAVKPFLAEGTTEISFSFNEKATYHFVESNLLLGRRQGPGVESCLLCIEVSFSTEKYMLRSRRSSTAATDCLIFQGFPVMRDCMQRRLIVGKYAWVQVAKLLFTESQLFLGFSEKYI